MAVFWRQHNLTLWKTEICFVQFTDFMLKFIVSQLFLYPLHDRKCLVLICLPGFCTHTIGVERVGAMGEGGANILFGTLDNRPTFSFKAYVKR